MINPLIVLNEYVFPRDERGTRDFYSFIECILIKLYELPNSIVNRYVNCLQVLRK